MIKMTYNSLLKLKSSASGICMTLFLSMCFSALAQVDSHDDSSFKTLVWADEFDGNGAIDTTKWFHQTQLPSTGSWFNNEIQHYTNREKNSYVKDGYLHIVALKEDYRDQGVSKRYTSARLNSKYAFTYGRVEVSAKLPSGKGTWPAIWTLGKNINEAGAYWQKEGFGTVNWPLCGEMDIMEHWGKNQDFVQSAVHNPSSYAREFINYEGRSIEGVSEDFHLYALEWTPEKLVFSVDGIVHYTYQPKKKNKKSWPFKADHYLLLNVAIEDIIDSTFTQGALVIDFVRVYQ